MVNDLVWCDLIWRLKRAGQESLARLYDYIFGNLLENINKKDMFKIDCINNVIRERYKELREVPRLINEPNSFGECPLFTAGRQRSSPVGIKKMWSPLRT